MSYVPGMPDHVQEKIKSLSEYQYQMASLEWQLQKIRTEHAQLQSELLEHCIDNNLPASDVFAAAAAPISVGMGKLPNEMLLYIFEYFLARNHRRIRTLLTVCKRWHSVVMQSPRLWARIQLSPAPYAQYRVVGSSRRYIEACLQRSQLLLLDIETNYDELRSCEEYIRDRILDTVKQVADDDEDHGIGYWVGNLDCDFASAKYEEYLREIFQELDLLVGPDSENMERWQSLDLCLPSALGCDMILQIWGRFVGRTPNLARASFAKLEELLDSLLDDEDEVEYLKSFPVLTGLCNLTLGDAMDNPFLSHLDTSSWTLRQLDIHYRSSLTGISELSQFPLLRKLSLTTSMGADAEVGYRYQGEQYPLFVVQLLNLQELNLFGNPHLLRHVNFDTPNLSDLLLCSRDGFHLHPSFSPSRIRWSVETPDDDYWTPEAISSTLKTLLKSSKRIEAVTIEAFARDYVPLVCAELKRLSSLPASLKSIVVELKDGIRDIFDLERRKEWMPVESGPVITAVSEPSPPHVTYGGILFAPSPPLSPGLPLAMVGQLRELAQTHERTQTTTPPLTDRQYFDHMEHMAYLRDQQYLAQMQQTAHQTDQQYFAQMQQAAISTYHIPRLYQPSISNSNLAQYDWNTSPNGTYGIAGGGAGDSARLGASNGMLIGSDPLPNDLFVGLSNSAPFDLQMMNYQEDDAFAGDMNFYFDNYSMYINEGGLDSVNGM